MKAIRVQYPPDDVRPLLLLHPRGNCWCLLESLWVGSETLDSRQELSYTIGVDVLLSPVVVSEAGFLTL